MAIIDYNSILSLRYAALSPSAKILIPVLSTLADNGSGALSPAHSKAATLAKYAGIRPKAVRTGLRDLADANIVSIQTCNGKPPSIQYRPIIRISKKKRTDLGDYDRGTSVITTEHLGDYDRGQAEKETLQTPAITGENDWHDSCALNNFFKDCLKQQQEDPDPVLQPEGATESENDIVVVSNSIQEEQEADPPRPEADPPHVEAHPKSAADKVSKPLIKQMTSKHGAGAVLTVLEGMGKFNGEIQNPDAYFRSCVANGWAPTSAAARDREEKQVRDAARFRREEEERREYDRKVKEFEESDPAMAQAAFDAINAM